ncbi:MAG: hypothetical protein J2P36_30350, partial [Ktedonobacteraceae bacterium]|nr:hypothetical protein [Ktedonobacteraceae bacterium]
MAEWWHGVNNAVLYCVQFDRELDESVLNRIARMMLDQPFGGLTHEEEYAALGEALRSDARLTELIPDCHGEQEFRDFLQRL